MAGNSLPDPNPRSGDASKSHEQAVALINAALTQIHGSGSFDLKVAGQDGLTIAVATSNPKFLAERRRVAGDFETIEELIKLGEKRPEPGSINTVTIGGENHPLKFDSMPALIRLVELGIDTAHKAYILIDEEKKQIESFVKRIDQLRKE